MLRESLSRGYGDVKLKTLFEPPCAALFTFGRIAMALFEFGRFVATRGAHHEMELHNINPFHLLTRHVNGDWGEVCEDDKKENELSVKEGFRIMSCYTVCGVRFWLITEAGRSVTTILLPDEY